MAGAIADLILRGANGFLNLWSSTDSSGKKAETPVNWTPQTLETKLSDALMKWSELVIACYLLNPDNPLVEDATRLRMLQILYPQATSWTPFDRDQFNRALVYPMWNAFPRAIFNALKDYLTHTKDRFAKSRATSARNEFLEALVNPFVYQWIYKAPPSADAWKKPLKSFSEKYCLIMLHTRDHFQLIGFTPLRRECHSLVEQAWTPWFSLMHDVSTHVHTPAQPGLKKGMYPNLQLEYLRRNVIPSLVCAMVFVINEYSATQCAKSAAAARATPQATPAPASAAAVARTGGARRSRSRSTSSKTGRSSHRATRPGASRNRRIALNAPFHAGLNPRDYAELQDSDGDWLVRPVIDRNVILLELSDFLKTPVLAELRLKRQVDGFTRAQLLRAILSLYANYKHQMTAPGHKLYIRALEPIRGRANAWRVRVSKERKSKLKDESWAL